MFWWKPLPKMLPNQELVAPQQSHHKSVGCCLDHQTLAWANFLSSHTLRTHELHQKLQRRTDEISCKSCNSFKFRIWDGFSHVGISISTPLALPPLLFQDHQTKQNNRIQWPCLHVTTKQKVGREKRRKKFAFSAPLHYKPSPVGTMISEFGT